VKSVFALGVLLGLVSLSVSATELSGEAVFKKSPCTACHAVDKKSVGPSVRTIANFYKDKDFATSSKQLADKVRIGGKGTFGVIPMPATSNSFSDADIKTVVEWMLKY